ncbi:hypothetical protein ACRJ4B_45765 [Streptomyces sp. GTA36]
MPFSPFEPTGNVAWRFRAVKVVDPVNEVAHVFQGTANPDSGGVPQAAIDALEADGWHVIVYKDQTHTSVLDTDVPE